MSSINRRHMLGVSVAAVGGAVLRPLGAYAHERASPALLTGTVPSHEPLRTEHFESGVLELESASTVALAAMLLDLHHRRCHDRACHGGSSGAHEAYLTSWIDSVTSELHSRREPTLG